MAGNNSTSCVSDGSWLANDLGSLCGDCSKRNLSSCSIFRPDVSEKLRVLAAKQTFAKDEVIFGEQSPTDRVFVILSGLVRRVKHLQNGRRYLAAFMGPGEIMGFISKDVHEFGAETISSTDVCSFSRHAFISVLKSDADLSRRLLNSVSNDLIETHIHSLVLAHETAKSRLAAFFQVMRAKELRRTGQDEYFDLAMKRQDIADYLGLALETVSRTIHQLEDDGAIGLEGFYRVWIKDIDHLADISTDVLAKASALGDLPGIETETSPS